MDLYSYRDEDSEWRTAADVFLADVGARVVTWTLWRCASSLSLRRSASTVLSSCFSRCCCGCLSRDRAAFALHIHTLYNSLTRASSLAIISCAWRCFSCRLYSRGIITDVERAVCSTTHLCSSRDLPLSSAALSLAEACSAYRHTHTYI